LKVSRATNKERKGKMPMGEASQATFTFILSAFGDEIADDLETQLQVLQELQIRFLELRGAWGKNVLHMSDGEISRVGELCRQYQITVSCIGSPVGKSALQAPLRAEMDNLRRIFEIGASLDTRRVRVFSFYPPETDRNGERDAQLVAAADRLGQLAGLAQQAGFDLLLENEKGLVGDTVARCHTLLRTVDSPHLHFLWDPANFVQVGETAPTTQGWPLLSPFTAHVHIKDAHLADGSVQPAGEGDGQIGLLLARLRDAGYQGFLALEPHLVIAGHSGGFSGVQGMHRAVAALRHLMAQESCIETHAGDNTAIA
jgi:sugar phosphate isomerase/epimerase